MSDLGRSELLELYDPLGPRDFAAYSFSDYRMTDARAEVLRGLLLKDDWRSRSYLDVSCGRGESLRIAFEHGWTPVGTEAVRSLVSGPSMVYAVLPDLPFGDGAFHTVSCIDVLEHILLEDWEPSVREFARVASDRIILCVSNTEDHFGQYVGHPLHVSRIPYQQTFDWLKEWAPGFTWSWEHGEEGDDGAWFVGVRA